MALAVEENVSADPGDVGLLGTTAIVPRADGLPDPIEEARFRNLRGTRLSGDEHTLSSAEDGIVDRPDRTRERYRRAAPFARTRADYSAELVREQADASVSLSIQ